MKPYRALCKSYERYVEDRMAYRDKAIHAVASALAALHKHLDAPDGVCRFTPINTNLNENTEYSPQGAVDYDDDGWWSGCLLIDVSCAGVGLAKEGTLCLTISAFVDDEIVFRVGDSDQRHRCTQIDATSLQPVIDEALSRSQEYLETGMERFLDEFSSTLSLRRWV